MRESVRQRRAKNPVMDPKPTKLNADEEDFEPEDYLSWSHGDCWLLAGALHHVTGLPIYASTDVDGAIQHAFVYDDDTQTAVDYRGRLPIQAFVRAIRGRGHRVIPAQAYVLREVELYGEDEWQAALRVAREIAALEGLL
jgi:hypothetical protein